MTRTGLITGLGAIVALTSGFGAVAQEQAENFFARDRYESVTDRYQEDFDPEPVRLGAFRMNSQLAVGVESDDNIFADAINPQSDVIAQIAPTVDLRSDWARNELGARAEIRHREYTDFGSESATDFRGELRGRIDAARGVSFNGALLASEETEARRSLDNLQRFEDPVRFQTAGVRAGAQFTRSRLRARADVETIDYTYDDVALVGGGMQPLDDRDYTYSRARGRVSYALSPDFAIFGQAEANTRDYDAPVPVNGMLESRDADGYALQAGANFELFVLLRGDIAIGYLQDEKDSDAFEDVDGLSVEADVQWFPSRLTTVTFNAQRNVSDPGIPQAGSATNTNLGVRVDHELLRNVLLFGALDSGKREYEDITREDDRLNLRVGATYKINKRIHLDGYVERFDRDSDVPAGDFEQNVVGLALRIFP